MYLVTCISKKPRYLSLLYRYSEEEDVHISGIYKKIHCMGIDAKNFKSEYKDVKGAQDEKFK